MNYLHYSIDDKHYAMAYAGSMEKQPTRELSYKILKDLPATMQIESICWEAFFAPPFAHKDCNTVSYVFKVVAEAIVLALLILATVLCVVLVVKCIKHCNKARDMRAQKKALEGKYKQLGLNVSDDTFKRLYKARDHMPVTNITVEQEKELTGM